MQELNSWVKYLAVEPFNSTEIQLALNTQAQVNSVGGKSSVDDLLITQYRHDKHTKKKSPSNAAIRAAFSTL